MKKTIFFSMFFFLWLSVIAQFPQVLKYQAVVRDESGGVLAGKSVMFRISILSGSVTGNVVYRENHSGMTTNGFGLIELGIGNGIPELGLFSAIPWGSGSYYVKVEIFPAGAAAWQEMGTSQLVSVPYAFYAKEVQNKDDADADAFNEIQVLSKSGNTVSLSKNGGSFTDSVDDADADPVNELQKLSITGPVLSLDKNGGSVTLPAGNDNWGSQVVKTDVTLTGQGTDTSPLGVSGAAVKPSWINIQNVPSGFADGADNVDDADADKTNELQDLQLTGAVLGLTGSDKTVTLPTSAGDNWGADVVKTDATLEGEGTTSKPLKIGGQLAIAGQVLKWDGISWKPSSDKVDDADNSATNEIQTLAMNGSNLSISGANSVVLPGDGWGPQAVKTNTTLTGLGTDVNLLGVANSVIAPLWANIQNVPSGFTDGVDNVDDEDHNLTNEIQTISLSNSILTLSKDGGSVAIPGDNWGIQSIITDGTMTGNGTFTNPLRIGRQAASEGQVLKWNGNTWAPSADETINGDSTPTGPAGGDLTGTFPNPIIGYGKISSVKILDGTIANVDIADEAINSAKILDGSLSAADLANSAVTNDKLASLAVNTDKIQEAAVIADKLADSAVTSAKINAGAVTGGKIAQAGATTGQALKWNGTIWAPANDETSIGNLMLPYSGNVDTSLPSFSVRNAGSGCAIQGKAPVYGITGTAESETELAFGVFGEAYSSGGSGVYGLATSLTGETNGVFGGVYSSSGIGVFGQSLASAGSTVGVKGRSSSSAGTGVYGSVSAVTGTNFGVYGTVNSSLGYGIFGEAHINGVYGKATGNEGRATTGEAIGVNSIGVLGKAISENSTGVWGEGYKQGIYGTSPFVTGRGVYGLATSAVGPTIGVYGAVHSPSGCGIYGEAPGVGAYGKSTVAGGRAIIGEAGEANSIAVWGKATMSNSTGMLGEGTNFGVVGTTVATDGTGVKGNATANNGTTYGLFGSSASFSGYGVYGQAPIFGVYGKTSAYEGNATVGEATGQNSVGVLGKAVADNSTGVIGEGSKYDFYANGPGVDYGTGSSIRWKKNISVIPLPLEMIKAIRGVYFDWDAAHGGKHDVGMIAEEIGKILPEIVVFEKNGVDAIGLDYSKVTPLLLEAVKAQQAEIEFLKAENNVLKTQNGQQFSKIASMESRLSKLESILEATSEK